MPSYRLSRRADADLDEILEFTVERWGLQQAGDYLDGLQSLFYLIAARPMMGRSAHRVMRYLRRVEHKSHIVFYTVIPSGVQIERVIHKSKALKKREFRP